MATLINFPKLNLTYQELRRRIRHFRYKWVEPVLPLMRLRQSISLYQRYLADKKKYAQMPGAERLRFLDTFPCLFDRTTTTPFDSHYFYQDIWAFKLIKASETPHHIDVGSRAIFVGMLTAITDVTFIDIRPLVTDLENYTSLPGSVLELPFPDNSIASISCLHVVEHIGLGRYGDPLDPYGTQKATQELARVLAPEGKLYFSVPLGQPRVCFNGHRIHSPQQILDYFADLKLVQFGAINQGRFMAQANPNDLVDAAYGCGLFYFTKN